MNAGPPAAAGQLVGRASQVAFAVDCLDDLDHSRGVLLLLTGESSASTSVRLRSSRS